ncbi:MAG: VWA domain-containing protein [Verrucomicrobia bacterium]|nr:VWA domain-containing protein [Verrucomicrobiota bacterium]
MKTNCHLDYESILHGRAEVVHLAISFRAEKQLSGRSQPFAFGLVIDNSGSMGGHPLEQAKAAAKMVLSNLREDDLVALVVFSESARTIIPLQTGTNRAALHAQIDAIQPEGSTNLMAGWMLGRDELEKSPGGIPRKLLLLTDGHLNAGITELGQIVPLITDATKNRQIRTSCLGFGDHYNEDLLATISTVGTGAMHDATEPEAFQKIFMLELESLLALSVQNLRVRVRKLQYCDRFGVVSSYTVLERPEGVFEITIGDLVSEEERVLVLVLEVLPLPLMGDGLPVASLEGEALLDLEIAYDEITEEGVHSRVEQRTIRISAVQNPAEVVRNGQAVRWVAIQEVGRMMMAAILERDNGDELVVRERIRRTKEKLEGYGMAKATEEALETLRVFEKKVVRWDLRSRKQVRHYSAMSTMTSSYFQAAPLKDESGVPNSKSPSPRRKRPPTPPLDAQP